MPITTTTTTVAPAYPPDPARLVLEAQKKSWDTFAPGWERWDDFTMRFLDDQRVALVEALGPVEGREVLDIAAGTGEPSLTLASEPHRARVTALDASEGMLRIARAKAAARGITDLRVVVGDACALPFEDESFDAISCRLGFMFFPDMARAAREMARVLKPGGVLATTVWAGPAHNPWVTTLVGAMKRHLELPTPPPGAPGMFRCAAPEAIPDLLGSAGLEVEARRLIEGRMRCRSAGEYWSFMKDVVPPVVAALRAAPADTTAAIEAEVRAAVDRLSPGPETSLGCGAHLVVARK